MSSIPETAPADNWAEFVGRPSIQNLRSSNPSVHGDLAAALHGLQAAMSVEWVAVREPSRPPPMNPRETWDDYFARNPGIRLKHLPVALPADLTAQLTALRAALRAAGIDVELLCYLWKHHTDISSHGGQQLLESMERQPREARRKDDRERHTDPVRDAVEWFDGSAQEWRQGRRYVQEFAAALLEALGSSPMLHPRTDIGPEAIAKTLSGRAADVLRVMLAHRAIDSNRANSQDTIAGWVKRGFTRRSLPSVWRKLREKKLITTGGVGSDSGTYLTPLGAAVAALMRAQ
jgi:hypothetical protein